MTASATAKTNLLGLSRPELEAFVATLGARPFRARQLMKWIYRKGESDFARMTDLAKDFRTRLEEVAEVRAPEVASVHASADGTRKWLLRAPGTTGVEQAIETVFIPEPGRGTLCISSQVGCAMDCAFCSTGRQGFNRNLSAAEIVGQVWLANRELGVGPDDTRAVTNVVLMGMGEPLANYRSVLPAMRIMMDDLGYDLSRRRVTLSTSGLVPQIYRLAEDCNVALAVSLHAPNDELRSRLVPINRMHPIAELLEACWHYLERQNGRSITFEYVLLDGVNDRPEHADELARLLRGRDAKVNLIPFNIFPGTQFRRSPEPVVTAFRDRLMRRGIIATIRRTRGDDIAAACGQLKGRVLDRTQMRLGRKLVGVRVHA